MDNQSARNSGEIDGRLGRPSKRLELLASEVMEVKYVAGQEALEEVPRSKKP